MTTAQYQAYEAAVASFLSGNHVIPGCHSPADPEREPFFSWRPCECCGSRLGGNRETYQFAYECARNRSKPETVVFDADICTDCVYYLAYGQLDDMTMMDLDR